MTNDEMRLRRRSLRGRVHDLRRGELLGQRAQGRSGDAHGSGRARHGRARARRPACRVGVYLRSDGRRNSPHGRFCAAAFKDHDGGSARRAAGEGGSRQIRRRPALFSPSVADLPTDWKIEQAIEGRGRRLRGRPAHHQLRRRFVRHAYRPYGVREFARLLRVLSEQQLLAQRRARRAGRRQDGAGLLVHRRAQRRRPRVSRASRTARGGASAASARGSQSVYPEGADRARAASGAVAHRQHLRGGQRRLHLSRGVVSGGQARSEGRERQRDRHR